MVKCMHFSLSGFYDFVLCTISNRYTMVVRIYRSKPTEPEGAARGQGGFTLP